MSVRNSPLCDCRLQFSLKLFNSALTAARLVCICTHVYDQSGLLKEGEEEGWGRGWG